MGQFNGIMKLQSLFFILILLGIGLSSCEKKCVIEKENSDLGAIISESPTGEDVVIYHSGFAGSNVGNHITTPVNNIEISFDGGQTREPINFSMYHVLRNPVSTTCEAKIDREVLFNTTAQTVTYKVSVINCSDCDERYFAENYVLVPVIPSGYTVLYDVSYTEVD